MNKTPTIVVIARAVAVNIAIAVVWYLIFGH
jgi:hypothetical protein